MSQLPSPTLDPRDIRHRDTLRVCLFVDPAVQIDVPPALRTLSASVKDLRDRKEIRSFSDVPLGETTLCPSVPLLMQGGKHPLNTSPSGSGPLPPRVDGSGMSPFSLWIALTTAPQIDRAFGPVTPHTSAEQVVCTGGACAEATTSFYLTVDEFNDPAKRERAIRLGLGG